MGGEGSTLTAALIYSGVVFSGAIPIWITALLSSALRGAGNVSVPAFVILGGAVILLPLSPAMIFGWARLAKRAAQMTQRYTHAKQFKRANRELKFLRIRLGRLIRDITRKIEGNPRLEAPSPGL